MSGLDNKYLDAESLHQQGRFEEAFSLLSELAHLGHTPSMLFAANMLTVGEGVPCDYDRAIELEERAAERGDVSAYLNLGISLRMKGRLDQARSWFQKALDAGDGTGALEIARLLNVSEKEKESILELLQVALNSRSLCCEDQQEALVLQKKWQLAT